MFKIEPRGVHCATLKVGLVFKTVSYILHSFNVAENDNIDNVADE